ncbi:MAG: hypothetical protein F6K30_28580 [Cyanothece sp. SIO2G6]|nr:hypothetical protein [Cyanothece sp. SIO2G6]
MEASSNHSTFLQFLLFVDRRPASSEKIRQIRQYLERKQGSSSIGLQVIDVGEQPSLVEHFRLVATPALVKIYPEPQQVFTGENFLSQMETWWPRWQQVLTGVPALMPASEEDELEETQT